MPVPGGQERRPDVASTRTEQQIHLFLDFDGTITVQDTGDELFRTFGAFEPVHTQLLNGEFSVREYYDRSVVLLREHEPSVIRAWAMTMEVDPGFSSLIAFCRTHQITPHIVSDGFDLYINAILQREGVTDIAVHCNQLMLDEGRWTAEYPGASESCSCFCASCKRNRIISALREQDLAIYVGDGRSDRCAAEHCDVVFAKHQLASWCTEQRIPHHPFRTLSDVQRILATKLVAIELRPRRQAFLARQRAVIAE